jgi:hypothetical protein
VRGVSNNSAAGSKERVETYVRAALDRAAASIVSAPKGTQAVTLHRACYAIGGLVAIAALDYRDAYVELTEAARRMPAYGERWTRLERIVEASLRRGMERPWTPLKGRGRPQTAAARQCQPQATVGSVNGHTTAGDALRLWREATNSLEFFTRGPRRQRRPQRYCARAPPRTRKPAGRIGELRALH